MALERVIGCVELWRKVIHRVWKPLCNSVFPQSVDNLMHYLTDVGEIRCSQAQPGQYSHEPHRSTGRHCHIATGYLHSVLVNSTTLALGKTGGKVANPLILDNNYVTLYSASRSCHALLHYTHRTSYMTLS